MRLGVVLDSSTGCIPRDAVLGVGFPQPSWQQDLLLFVRYILEIHPDLVLDVKNEEEPLLCCLPHLPCSPWGQGHGWHPWLAQLQCDHPKGKWVPHTTK